MLAATTAGSTATFCQPSLVGGVASDIPHSVCPAPRITLVTSLPGNDHDSSPAIRCSNVELPAWAWYRVAVPSTHGAATVPTVTRCRIGAAASFRCSVAASTTRPRSGAKSQSTRLNSW